MNYYPDKLIPEYSDYKVVKDYSCKLHRQDGYPGFYLLQLLEELNRASVYHVYSRWGKEGHVGNQRMSASINLLEDAIKVFERRYQARTGVSWRDRDIDDYEGKYRLIDDEEYSSTKKLEPLQEKQSKKQEEEKSSLSERATKRRRDETPLSEQEEKAPAESGENISEEEEEEGGQEEQERYMRELAKNRDRARQKSTMHNEPAKPKSMIRKPLGEAKSPSKTQLTSNKDKIKEEKYCQILRDLCFEINILQELDSKLLGSHDDDDPHELLKKLTDQFYKEVSHIFEGKKKPLIDNNEACIKVLHEVLEYKKNESKENK
jgi:hypothetical protein